MRTASKAYTEKRMEQLQMESPDKLQKDCFACKQNQRNQFYFCSILTEMFCLTKGKCSFYKKVTDMDQPEATRISTGYLDYEGPLEADNFEL